MAEFGNGWRFVVANKLNSHGEIKLEIVIVNSCPPEERLDKEDASRLIDHLQAVFKI